MRHTVRSGMPGTVILLTILLDSVGIGLVTPVLPSLIQEVSGRSGAAAGMPLGVLLSTYSVALFLFAPVMGGISDRFGRRPVILIALIITVIDYAVSATTTHFGVLLSARLVAGACGSSMVVALAYVADASMQDKRAQSFGLVWTAYGLGLMLGPIIGGLLGSLGTRAPFWAAASAAAVNLLLVLWRLPESLGVEMRRDVKWRDIDPRTFVARVRGLELGGVLLCVVMLFEFSMAAVQAVWVLALQFRLAWTTTQIGTFLSVAAVLSAVVQAGVVRHVVARLGERRAVLVGGAFGVVGLVMFGIADESWKMYLALTVWVVGSIAGPTLRGVITGRIPANRQGELSGSLTSLSILMMVVGAPASTGVFSYFTGPHAPIVEPGAAFFLAAIALGAAMMVWNLLGPRSLGGAAALS